MASVDTKSGNWFARLWPKRLTLGFAISVTASVLITEMIFLVPASFFWHKSNQIAAIENVRLAWYHSSNPSDFLTPEEKTRIGERMIRDGLINGGVVFDSAGDPLAVFGERPILDLNIARLSGIALQESPTGNGIDLHLPPEQTELSHHIIVRLPNEPIEQATIMQLRNFALSVLFIAGLTAMLFIAASTLLVIRPLRSINEALRRAIGNPDKADDYQLDTARGDEIGQITASLNMLLASVSVVFQDELAALKQANEAFGFGILQYDHDDRMVAANPMALRLFGQNDFDSLRRMNRNCAQPLGAKGTRPQPIIDLLGDTREPMLLTLHTDTGYFTAMAFCATVRRPDGGLTNRSVAIIAMDDILHDSRRAITQGKKARTEAQSSLVENKELRRLLEACLCLLEPETSTPDDILDHFLPDRILNGWYQEAQRDELVTGELEHGLLLPVRGDAKALRNVLRQAMLLAYSQTKVERPVLKVDTEKLDNGDIGFVVSDMSPKREDVGTRHRKKAVDPTLPQAALVRALRQASGSFAGMDSDSGVVRVRFTLKAANTSGHSARQAA